MNAAIKQQLRQHYRAVRRAHVASIGQAREAAEQALAAWLAPHIADTTAVAGYAARGAEIDPRWIVGGREMAYPRLTPDGLEFRLCPLALLAPGHSGIAEPAADRPLLVPRLLLVPLLAAAPDGTRLGQGGGYYDRALCHLRHAGPVTAIGIAWDVQLVPALPADPWDERLDWIATPTRLVECAANR